MDALRDDPAQRRRALFIGGGVLLVLLAVAVGYQLIQADHVFPGVHVGMVDVGGLTRDAAAERLVAAGLGADSTINLRDPDSGRIFPRPAAEVGLQRRPEALAEAAFDIGRSGVNPIARVFHPLLFLFTRPTVGATAEFDAELATATLAQLAPDIDVAPRNAAVSQEGDHLVAIPERLGRQLDVSGTLHALALLAADPVTDTVDIALQRTGARVPDLANVADAYNMVVSKPLNVGWRDAARFEVPVATLRQWAQVIEAPNPQGDRVPTLVFDRAAIGTWLEEQRAHIDQPAVNARFILNDTGQFVVADGGQPALALDVDASIDALIEAAYQDVRFGELAVIQTPAPASPGALDQMAGMAELTRASTALGADQPRRLAQLTAAAARLNGAAVAPGGYFSFNQALGPIVSDAGFDAVLSTQADLDGAISQACTNVLRTVWWAGLPILERHAPPVRQGWVEPPVGLDCAVGANEDLRFLHDGSGYLVFETRLDPDRGLFTVILYGRPLERQVSTIGPRVTNVTPAGPPRALRAPGLTAGERVQLRWAREGAEATIERTARAGDRIVAHDAWTSRYAATGDVVLVGQ